MGRKAIAATQSVRRELLRINRSDKPKETKDYRFEFEDIYSGRIQKGIEWLQAKTDSQALNKYNKKHPNAKLITWGSFDKESFGKSTIITGEY